jgi:Zn-dependent peptidase ImmA (M78 family)
MRKASARATLFTHWDGCLPVDPDAMARSVGVEVAYESGMGSILGRVDVVDGRRRIVVNADQSETMRRYTVAHELGHCVLGHDVPLDDTAFELDPKRVILIEKQANLFAMELLIPGFIVEVVIMKLNITGFTEMIETFNVPDAALEHKLQILGWIPWNWKEKALGGWRRFQRNLEREERRWERIMAMG